MAMKVTPLSGTDYPASEESYAQVVWLLKKYSSWTYINRLCQLFGTFVREYFDYASRGQHEGTPQFYRETLIRLYDYQARLERGLGLLGKGDRSGYREIWTGCDFSSYMWSRGFEYCTAFEEVGYRQREAWGADSSTGLFRWAELAIHMAVNMKWTVGVDWTFERIFVPLNGRPHLLPEKVPPLIRPRTVRTVPQDGEVPLSGIWQPIDVPKGCPNYIVAGSKKVPTFVPEKRLDRPLEPYEMDGGPLKRAILTYKFKSVPTRWQLLWEDTRYRDGVIPDESEYLDPTTQFPDDGITPAPPVAVARPPSTRSETSDTR